MRLVCNDRVASGSPFHFVPSGPWLEAANLVATVRRGREKLHFLNPVPLQALYERWIAKFDKPRRKAISELKKRLETTNG